MRRKELDVIAFHGWQADAFNLIRPLFPRLGKPVHDTLQRFNRSANLDLTIQSPKNQLQPYERKVFSQQGEDGILHEIFFRIGSGRRYFVEFGVEDGTQCNTALLCKRYHWSGLYIEAEERWAQALRSRLAGRPDVAVEQAFVTAENLAAIFAKHDVPTEFDLLSIDIDGNDYWAWKALAHYRPRVVVIEYNAAYPPPRRWIMAYDPNHRWDGSTHLGASLSALGRLGEKLGYALLGTERHGLNAFFLRRDLLSSSGFLEASPEHAYHPPRYGLLGIRWPFRPGPFTEDDEIAARPEAARDR